MGHINKTPIKRHIKKIFNIDKAHSHHITLGTIPPADSPVRIVAKLYYNKLTKSARVVIMPNQDS